MRFEGLTILANRADFLKAASARRVSTPAFTLQYRQRAEDEAVGIRVGFTWNARPGGKPSWEQALSGDSGVTWETNWTMEFERSQSLSV